MRWFHEFGPELNKRIRLYLKPTNDSYRTDETYIKIKGHVAAAAGKITKRIVWILVPFLGQLATGNAFGTPSV
jgi:transposase-like protein